MRPESVPVVEPLEQMVGQGVEVGGLERVLAERVEDRQDGLVAPVGLRNNG